MTTVTREPAAPAAPAAKPRREPPEVTILKEARKLIERGWVQGVTVALREDGVYRYCARGALIANRDTAKNFFAAYTKAGALLDAEAPPRGPLGTRCIVWFNDDAATTKQDILDAYDRAIQKALKGAS